MGTSNLYKGPKGSSLLPVDYTDETDSPSVDTAIDETPDKEGLPGDEVTVGDDNLEQEEPQREDASLISWTQAKRTFTNQIGKRSPNVRLIVKTYTKASGGYKHAAATSTSSKRVARGIISLFSGAPDTIRRRIEQIGIVFVGRSTQEIFNDIYSYLCTGAATRADALADKALSQTFSELFESERMSEQSMEVFTPELLEFLVSHFIANSIYYKLLNEVSFGELTSDKDNSDIAKIEDELKTFIDGLVDGRVPEHLHEGITHDEVGKMVDDLYEDCYKVMEGLAE